MARKRTFLVAAAATVAAAVSWLTRSDDGVPKIAPVIGPMAASGGFAFASKPNKTRRSASGIAFTRPGLAFIAFDEGLEGRFATLTEDRYIAEPQAVPLRTDGVEVDAEGAASDGKRLYVVGSHAVKRKGGGNDTSRILARFDLAADGRPKGAASGAVEPPALGDLMPALRSQPILAAALDRDLSDGEGLNIEGLAVSGGRLWIGFRGPTDGENALILSLDADAPFSGGDAAARLDRVAIGAGRGVRDMTAVEGGFLLLAGPDDDPANAGDWTIAFWDGQTGVRTLAALDLSEVALRGGLDGCDDAEIKPEAIAAVRTQGGAYRVAILSDGLCDGGPMWFDAPMRSGAGS